MVYTEAEVKALGDVLEKHDLWIISDDIYNRMIFDGIGPAPAARDADQCGCNAFQRPGAVGCPQVNSEAQGYQKYQ